MSIGQIEWLSWRGYSERKQISLNGWCQGFAFPSQFYESVPFCIESYTHLKDISADERIALQQKLLELTQHSVMSAIYMGVIRAADIDWFKRQLSLALRTMIRLMQLATIDDIAGDEISQVFKTLPVKSAQYLKSALSSSLYYYANGKIEAPFQKTLAQPMYVELGIDMLSSGSSFMLAEFQVRYSTPYPHLLDYMSASYQEIMPELFAKFGLKPESFSKRRMGMFNQCLERFAALGPDMPAKLVIDAWAYLQNPGLNLKQTAEQLEADYLLFDDMNQGQNLYEKTYRGQRLAIFNQPPLNLLDPANELFELVNAERLEWYNELGWSGLLDAYLRGQVFMASSPVSDIINDKALYSVLKELAKELFQEELDLPIVDAMPCWSIDDFKKPDETILTQVKENKDKFVIAHRYLEGGLGIRVGPAISQEEWESFIDTFVKDRPYLYLIRSYFPMDPDVSLRMLACASLPQMTADCCEAQMEFTDTLYARLATQPPVATDNHRSFLIFPADAAAPEPRYLFESKDVSNR